MNKILKTLGTIGILGLLLIGCSKTETTAGPGGGEPTAIPTLSGLQYKVVSGAVAGDDTSASGTGALVFRNPIPDEDNNYALSVNLPDGGSVTLVANADVSLSSGVEFKLARKGTKLEVALKVESEEYDLSEDFAGVNAAQPFQIAADIHGHGHVIVELGALPELEYAFTTRVPGKFWGLKLDNGSVTSVVRAAAKHEH